MAFGNMAGLEAEAAALDLVAPGLHQGSVLVEVDKAALDGDLAESLASVLAKAAAEEPARATGLFRGTALRWALVARTVPEWVFRIAGKPGEGDERPLAVLRMAYESALARVYPQTSSGATVAEAPDPPLDSVPAGPSGPSSPSGAFFGRGKGTFPGGLPGARRSPHGAQPLVVLPVFPGTNCEWDMERAFRRAGARTRLVIFRNRNSGDIRESRQELAAAIAEAQILALSGGFSAGDEPDGSGKFIANVFRSPAVAEEMTKLLEVRDGLVLGICNGFQALIKLGLVPYGKYLEAESPACKAAPTLSFNRIGRHVSRMVRTTVIATASPWLALEEPGALHVLPVSHGEGRVVLREDEGRALFAAGQVPFCYADYQGNPTMAEPDNPNGSDFAIEALTSPDGRILGKMAHSERCGKYVHINIPGNKRQRLFEAGVSYFTAS
jgi:phosphoribosylformylglycinamidine synthase